MEFSAAQHIIKTLSDAIVAHVDEASSAKVYVELKNEDWASLIICAIVVDEKDDLVMCEQLCLDEPSLELAHFGQFIEEINRYNCDGATITDDIIDRLRMAVSDAYEEAR